MFVCLFVFYLTPLAITEYMGFFFLGLVSSLTRVPGSSSMKPLASVSVFPLKYHSLLPFRTNQRFFQVLMLPPCLVQKPSLSAGCRLATLT